MLSNQVVHKINQWFKREKAFVGLFCLYSFEAADLDDVFKDNVRKSKYEKPTPVQKWAIPAIMKGRDLMSCAQTGSGKTVSICDCASSSMLNLIFNLFGTRKKFEAARVLIDYG